MRKFSLVLCLVLVLTSCSGGGVKRKYEVVLADGQTQVLEYQRCSASPAASLLGGAQVLNVHCFTNTEDNWNTVEEYDAVALSLREIQE